MKHEFCDPLYPPYQFQHDVDCLIQIFDLIISQFRKQ